MTSTPTSPLPDAGAVRTQDQDYDASQSAVVDAQRTVSANQEATPASESVAAVMSSLQPPRDGFWDATALLASACSELRLGQMVAVSHFTLMDSMAAVKIMDARMDSGMDLPTSELPESDRLDPLKTGTSAVVFDPFQPLAVSDVLWIMDRLLACEAAWHQGSALSQTLYTCLYFHDLKCLSPKHPRFQHMHQDAFHSNPSSSGSSTVHSESKTARPSSQLVYKVLRAFILGTVKTIDIAWSELTSKQHLQDGEDFSSDKNGLSLFESTDTGYVIAELEDALEWIQSQSESQSGPLLQKDVESLKARMNFRKQMLHAVRLLQSPAEAAPLDVVMHAKFARRNWASLRPADDVQPSESHSSARDTIPDRNADTNSTAALPLHRPDRNAAPSLAAAASFDPAYNRRLAWCQALRPISLPDPSVTWRMLDGILDELQQVVSVLQQPGFLSWKSFFTYRSVEYQTSQPISATPYVRSLYQTAVCDRNMVASRLPMEWLAENFFQEVALVDPLLLRRASRIRRSNFEGGSHTLWNAPPPLGQRIYYFMQRVSGQLVHYLSTLSQNRSRCKRVLASKLYREWVHISQEASELGRQLEESLAPAEPYLPDSLFAASQHLALEIMSQIIFSGFELDLYAKGIDRQVMWWLASRIQAEQVVVCTDLRDELTKWLQSCPPDQAPRRHTATILYLSRQIHLARALEQLVFSTIYLMHLSTRSGTDDKRSHQPCKWPLEPKDGASALELARAIFQTRVKWMRSSAPRRSEPNNAVEGTNQSETHLLWNDFLAFRAMVIEADGTALMLKARDHLDKSIKHLEHITDTFDGDARALGATDFGEFVDSLLATARHNRDSLEVVRTHQEVQAVQKTSTASVAEAMPETASQTAWTFEHPWIPKWTLADSMKAAVNHT